MKNFRSLHCQKYFTFVILESAKGVADNSRSQLLPRNGILEEFKKNPTVKDEMQQNYFLNFPACF